MSPETNCRLTGLDEIRGRWIKALGQSCPRCGANPGQRCHIVEVADAQAGVAHHAARYRDADELTTTDAEELTLP